MPVESKKTRPRYEVVRESLLDEITTMDAGTQLDSVKGLMSRFGVSQVTVDRALRHLKDKGFIESRVGQGIFVSDRHRTQVGDGLLNVDVFMFGGKQSMVEGEGFHHDVVKAIAQYLGERGLFLRISYLPRQFDVNSFSEHVDKLGASAVIAMFAPDPQVADMLARRRIPCVQIIPFWPVPLPNSICVDNRSIARHWVEHLTGLGHRRIAFLHGVEATHFNPDMTDRLRFFYEEMEARSLKVDPSLVTFGGWDRATGYKTVSSLLNSGKRFTAIVTNDHNASGVYAALEEWGLVIGRDVSVIGTSDLAWAAHMHPPLTTVRIGRSLLAELAVTRLQNLITGKASNYDIEQIPVRLVERESTGPAPADA